MRIRYLPAFGTGWCKRHLVEVRHLPTGTVARCEVYRYRVFPAVRTALSLLRSLLRCGPGSREVVRTYSLSAHRRPVIRDARGVVLTGEAVGAVMDRGEMDELVAAGVKARAAKS